MIITIRESTSVERSAIEDIWVYDNSDYRWEVVLKTKMGCLTDYGYSPSRRKALKAAEKAGDNLSKYQFISFTNCPEEEEDDGS